MMSKRLNALSAVFLLCIALAACTGGKRVSTDWATPGTTTRLTVKERLGEPAEYYENGTILAYRLVRYPGYFSQYDEDFTIATPGEGRTNLIFTFDDNGALLSVSRVELKD